MRRQETVRTGLPREVVVVPFHAIAVRGPGLLRVAQAPRRSVLISAPDELIPHIDVAVSDGELMVTLRPPTVTPLRRWRDLVIYDITLPELDRLRLHGSAHAEIADLDSDELVIDLQGSARVTIEQLTGDRLHCTIAGSGRVNVAGDVETQDVSIDGSGVYRAEELVSDFAALKVNGSGQISVAVNHELEAAVTGSGRISYKGHPDLYPRVIGSGSIARSSSRESRNANLEAPRR